jgi:hypothetical protein
MSSTSTDAFRDAAVRMVAATEYFKSTGELPTWAQTELDSWDQDPVAVAIRRRSALAPTT